jgi:hypothetical protein
MRLNLRVGVLVSISRNDYPGEKAIEFVTKRNGGSGVRKDSKFRGVGVNLNDHPEIFKLGSGKSTRGRTNKFTLTVQGGPGGTELKHQFEVVSRKGSERTILAKVDNKHKRPSTVQHVYLLGAADAEGSRHITSANDITQHTSRMTGFDLADKTAHFTDLQGRVTTAAESPAVQARKTQNDTVQDALNKALNDFTMQRSSTGSVPNDNAGRNEKYKHKERVTKQPPPQIPDEAEINDERKRQVTETVEACFFGEGAKSSVIAGVINAASANPGLTNFLTTNIGTDSKCRCVGMSDPSLVEASARGLSLGNLVSDSRESIAEGLLVRGKKLADNGFTATFSRQTGALNTSVPIQSDCFTITEAAGLAKAHPNVEVVYHAIIRYSSNHSDTRAGTGDREQRQSGSWCKWFGVAARRVVLASGGKAALGSIVFSVHGNSVANSNAFQPTASKRIATWVREVSFL